MTEAASELLRSLGIDSFEHPGRAWLLLSVAGLALLATIRAGAPALAWPARIEAQAAGARRFDAVRVLGLVVRGACLVLLAAVLAGPVGVHRAAPEPGHGLDLALVVDASGSMRALDTEVAGEWRTRLDLAREVVARFASQRAAEGDRVALVVFGEAAFTQCPLTSDGALLAAALARVQPGIAGEATALGDALALAVKRVAGGGTLAGPAPGRVAVLLTDGRHNAGAVSVDVAVSLAQSAGIRVHTVAIGSSGDEVAMASPQGAPQGLRFERHDVDTATLEHIARATGGRFFPARRSGDLERVYAEIDSLERIARPLPPRVRHAPRPEPLLALAGGLLLVEIGVVRVARRRLP